MITWITYLLPHFNIFMTTNGLSKFEGRQVGGNKPTGDS